MYYYVWSWLVIVYLLLTVLPMSDGVRLTSHLLGDFFSNHLERERIYFIKRSTKYDSRASTTTLNFTLLNKHWTLTFACNLCHA